MTRLVAAAVLACGVSVFASEAPYRQIHRVFCTDADKIAAAADAYPNAFGTGLIISAFNQLRGPAGVSDFTNCVSFFSRFRARGLDVQICPGTAIGHSDRHTIPGDYPMLVGANGARAKAQACPRTEKFLAHLRTEYARYAALRPSVIWIDDDLRMNFHRPADFICFCNGCLKRFEAETGCAYDRKGLVKALLDDAKSASGTSRPGVAVRKLWRDYNVRAANEIVRTVAEAVQAVDPAISIGLMVCNPDNPHGQGYAPPDFRTWIDLCTKTGAKVWFRHGSGAYTDQTPYEEAHGLIHKNVQIARACAATEGPRVVNLTEEVTAPYIRRTKSMRMTFLEAVLNIGMAGAEGTTYDAIKPNLDEQLRPDAVVAEMHRRYPELNRMRALVRGKRQVGAWPKPLGDRWLRCGKVKTLMAAADAGPERWIPLLYLGVPITFRRAGAAVTLENRPYRNVLRRKESEELKDALDRRAGGRMPSRLDSALRIGQSVWESPDGRERIVFVYNFDFDDATDLLLTENGTYDAETLNRDGSWSGLGTGDVFRLPTVPAWSAQLVRLSKGNR